MADCPGPLGSHLPFSVTATQPAEKGGQVPCDTRFCRGFRGSAGASPRFSTGCQGDIFVFASPRLFCRCLVMGLALFVLAMSPLVSEGQDKADGSKLAEPIREGQRVFTCGHSFHVWVPDIVADLAKLAEIPNHVQVGLSSIGGSRTIQ